MHRQSMRIAYMQLGFSVLILGVLAEAPMHGYAIAREIELRSKESLRCAEGTLYPALRRLEREGRIVGAWEQMPRSRKVYSLTDKGQQELVRVRTVWGAYAKAVDRVLGQGMAYGH